MSLLDQVLANTTTGSPRIVGQNHDLGSITVAQGDIDAALRSLGGAWDAAEMGISREEVVRRMAEADTPEARERLMVELRQRAVKRAGLDVSNGRVNVMVAGALPWHGLGVNVAEAVSSEHAILLSGLNWLVSKIPMRYTDTAGAEHTCDDTFAIVRNDTGTKLGTVGSRYKPIQNADGFKFMDEVLGQFGARYETAGAVYGGEKVWMLVKLPQQSFVVGKTDQVDAYAMFSNPHDGSGMAYCYPTSVRVVCNNTLRVSHGDRSKGIGIRHVGDVKHRVSEAKHALGTAVMEIADFQRDVSMLAASKLESAAGYFNGVLDAVLDVTQAQMLKGVNAFEAVMLATDAEAKERARKSAQRQIDARTNILDDILTRYESERCGINGMRGTAWSGLNAVTEFADHSVLRKYKADGDGLSRRFESTLAGDADEIKQVAFVHAMAAAKA